MAFPLRLQRRYVDNNSTARVRRFSQADRQHVARNAKVFDGARKRERIRRDDANIAFQVDERIGVERLWIDDRAVDVGEDLEFIGAANVLAVTRGAVADNALAVHVANLSRLERLDHALRGHAANPFIAFDAHWDGGPE